MDPAADGAGGQADAGLGAFAAGLGGSARDLGFGESFEQRVGHVPSADCFASMFVRQVRQCFSVVWADGFPRCRHRFPVMCVFRQVGVSCLVMYFFRV